MPPQMPAHKIGQRHALVIGAISYPGEELLNAAADARRVGDVLRARGFEVTILIDPVGAEIDRTLADFGTSTQEADLAMIYLAGHAVERHGSGYFLPVDFQFPLQPGSLPYIAVSLNHFVAATEGAASRIVVLDACRNWPQDPDEARRISNDLDQLVADERDWPNLLLAYATSATRAAGDGAKGESGPFTTALCKHLLDHSLTVDECFRRVSQDVVAKQPTQQPWTYSSLAQTLSFTDLPRFTPIQRHAVPNPEKFGTGAWTAPAAEKGAVIAGVGDPLAWKISVKGCTQIRHPGGDYLMGAADLGHHILLAGSEGALYIAGAGADPALDFEMRQSHGLTLSPIGDRAIYYGADAASLMKIGHDDIQIVACYKLDFRPYCCIYVPDGRVWLAGEHGTICEIDPNDAHVRVRSIAGVDQHVNAMIATPNGERIFVVGQNGLAAEIDRSGKLVADLLPGRGFQSAAAIWGQLAHIANDDDIYRFIFEPAALDECAREEMSEHLGRPSFHSCALAPTLPVLAIGTAEASVVLLDTRDMQLIEELDVGSGHSSIVAGVHFLSDSELVVVGGRGDVTFFASRAGR